MSGNIRGKIDCYSDTGLTSRNGQEIFKGLYDFWSAHPLATIVARQAGNGGAADYDGYWDDAKPFTTGAWFVVRLAASAVRSFPIYILVQYAVGTFGASPGNPGLLLNTAGASGYGIGFQVAIGQGGDENPWKGAGSFGLNTKGDPVWGTPTTGTRAHIFPRSNSLGGSHTVHTENCSGWYYASSSVSKHRWNIVADDDSFIVGCDYNDDGTYFTQALLYLTERPGLGLTYPYAMLATSSAGIESYTGLATAFGDTAGTSVTNGGAILRDTSLTVKACAISFLSDFNSGTYEPNVLFAAAEFDEFPIALAAKETPYFGLLGYCDFIRLVPNIAWKATSLDLKRMMMRATGTGLAVSIPWDGATTPGTTLVRAGVDFSRAP